MEYVKLSSTDDSLEMDRCGDGEEVETTRRGELSDMGSMLFRRFNMDGCSRRNKYTSIEKWPSIVGYDTRSTDNDYNDSRADSTEKENVNIVIKRVKHQSKTDVKHHRSKTDNGREIGHPSDDSDTDVEELNTTLDCLNLDEQFTYWAEILKPDSDGDNLLFISIILRVNHLTKLLINLIPDNTMFQCSNKMLQNALHIAALTDNAEVARRLVVAGTKVKHRDVHGNTPLHIACKRGCIEVAATLVKPVSYLESKLNSYEVPYQKIPQDLSIRNGDGLACLHLAAMQRNKRMMELLLSKDADVNVVDMKSGKTCLHMFAETGDVEMLRFLLTNRGVTVNARTYAGFSALELAFYKGHYAAADLLLRAGAETDIRPVYSPEFLADSDLEEDDEDSDCDMEDECLKAT